MPTSSPRPIRPGVPHGRVDAEAQLALAAEGLEPARLRRQSVLRDVDHPAALGALDHLELDVTDADDCRRSTSPRRTARSSRPRGWSAAGGRRRRRRGARGTSRAKRCRRSRRRRRPGGRSSSSATHPHPRTHVGAQRVVERRVADQPGSHRAPRSVRRPRSSPARNSKISSRRRNRRLSLPVAIRPSSSQTANQRSPSRPRASRADGVERLPGHRLDRVAAELVESSSAAHSARCMTWRSAYDPSGSRKAAGTVPMISNPSDSHRRTAAIVGRHDGVELDRREAGGAVPVDGVLPHQPTDPPASRRGADHEATRCRRASPAPVGWRASSPSRGRARRRSTTTTCSPRPERTGLLDRGGHVHRVGLAGRRDLDDEVVDLRPVALLDGPDQRHE